MATRNEKLSAAEWIWKLRDHKNLSHAEKVALTDFIRESPIRVRELIEHMFISESLKELPIPQSELDKWVGEARSAVTGTIQFTQTLGLQSEALHNDGRRAQSSWTRFAARLGVAASLVAVLAIGFLLHSRIGLYRTGFGEQRILTLADGSVVTINTESQIKIKFSDRNRLIELQKGEAFFRVAHDANRPFFVKANEATVRAVGTQFNVKIAPQDTVVSVLDGVVKVSLNKNSLSLPLNAATQGEAPEVRRNESTITLTKGQEVRIGRRELASGRSALPFSKAETPAALHAAAWAQGRMEFEGSPLGEVLAEFQRYRQLDIEIDDDTTRQLKLTGSFASNDPESALAYIATIPGIVVEKRGPASYFVHRR